MAAISIVDGLDPSALRLFLNAVEFGSVSKAAGRMNVSQPSATAKLQKLERQLGTTLLERSRVGSRPTDTGDRLAPACAEVLAAIERLVDRAEAVRTERRRLTVAITRHVADHFLPDWMSELDLERIQLDLIETSTRDVARTLRADAAVLGFTEGPNPPIGLGSAVVGSEPVVAVVGRGHPWFERTTAVSVREITEATLVVRAAGSGTRDVVESALGVGAFSAAAGHDLIEVANGSIARLVALSGDGVAFLPSCWTTELERAGSLRRVDIADVTITQPVRVAWRGTSPPTRAARDVVDRLAALRAQSDPAAPQPS